MSKHNDIKLVTCKVGYMFSYLGEYRAEKAAGKRKNFGN